MSDYTFTREDFDLIIEGLEMLPQKGMVSEMMNAMLEGMMSPSDDATMEEKKAFEERIRIRELERGLRESDRRELQGKAELLKARIVLMRAELM